MATIVPLAVLYLFVFGLRLNVHVNYFSVMLGWYQPFLRNSSNELLKDTMLQEVACCLVLHIEPKSPKTLILSGDKMLIFILKCIFLQVQSHNVLHKGS